MRVTEGIGGVWHYHISEDAKFTRGLCGAQTMHTAIPIEQWGKKFGEHFPKHPTWCRQCETRAGVRRSVTQEKI